MIAVSIYIFEKKSGWKDGFSFAFDNVAYLKKEDCFFLRGKCGLAFNGRSQRASQRQDYDVIIYPQDPLLHVSGSW